MKEYINHNRPSTKTTIFPTMESYEKAWGDNINDSLLKRASELAGIAGSILGRACTVTAEYEERTHKEYVPPFRQKATVTYRIPMLSVEGTELSLSLEWFESLCAPLPPELPCKIPDITAFDPNAEPEKVIRAVLQAYYDGQTERLLYVLNDGVTGRKAKKWIRNGRYMRKIKTWVCIGGSFSCVKIAIFISRLRSKADGVGFTFRCGLFSPYSPYMIPQALHVVFSILSQKKGKTVGGQLKNLAISRYRYKKWLGDIHAWAENDRQANNLPQYGDDLDESGKSESVRSFLAGVADYHYFHLSHMSTAPDGPFSSGMP